MFLSRSITINDPDLGDVAAAAEYSDAFLADDAVFIDKLRAGDADAFDELITLYSADIYSLLFRLTDNAEEAGDLTQETFFSAFRSIGKFRGESGLKTWLYRIAVNHSRNRFRWWKRRSRDKTISLDVSLEDGERSLHESIPGSSIDPETALLSAEREKALYAALGELPAKYREVVILRDIEGMKYEEIATAVGLNIGTVKSRIARGRYELQKRLKDI